MGRLRKKAANLSILSSFLMIAEDAASLTPSTSIGIAIGRLTSLALLRVAM